MVSTRSGPYAPEPPERMSRFSRIVVGVELSVAAVLVISVAAYHVSRNREDTSPIKIASVALPTASLPTGAVPAGGDASAGAGEDGSPDKGHVLYMQSCTSCHGQKAQGLPHMGLNLRESKFVAQLNDRRLVAFLKQGRKPTDPKNVTGLLMPARGGNSSLDDDGLADIVAYLRQVQKEEQAAQAERRGPEREASTDKGSPTASLSPAPATRPVAGLDLSPLPGGDAAEGAGAP
ncbi:MAG TPA: cytochrome c [Tepidisphaeraceae bacterium]|nr:cytochrome c [Tepidisphaeraceae bacterium]